MRDITISIVSHGHKNHVLQLLKDLQALAASSTSLQVILTLNIPEVAPSKENFPQLLLTILINDKPKGFGANHNAAFSLCTSPWFVIMNPDLRLPSNPFPSMMQLACSDICTAVVTPLIFNSKGQKEDHVRHNLTPSSLLYRALGIEEVVETHRMSCKRSPFYWLAGMFLMFRATAYKAVGGFDERFFLYCEDYDICARLYLKGYAHGVALNAKAIHDAQRDSHRSLRHLRWHLVSILKVWTSRVFWRIFLTS